MSFRKQRSTITDPDESSGGNDGWIWGNTRGGGGAPLRDAHGNTVTNLKPIVNSHDNSSSKNKRDYSPPPYESPMRKGPRNQVPPFRRNLNEEDGYSDDPRGRRSLTPEPRPGRRIPGLDDPYREPAAHNNHSPEGSPKKFMSAIKEMNSSSSTQERLVKQKKEQDYQNALRQQIEENKRRKEEDKRKEDDMKRREYEEFMRDRGMPVNQPANTGNRAAFRDDSDDNSDRNARNRNGGGGGGKKKGIPGLDFDAEDDIGPDNRYDLPPKKNIRQQQGGIGRRGYENEDDDQPDRSGAKRNVKGNVPPLAPRRGVARDEDYDEPPARRGGVPPLGGLGGAASRKTSKGGYVDEDGYNSADYGSDYGRNPPRQGGGNSKHRAKTADGEDDFVRVEQYDELSQLCDKLLAQQEALQSEIEQQASLIKSLQKGGVGGAKGAVAGKGALGMPGAGALRSKSAFQGSRSSSVERARAGGVPGGSVNEGRSKSAVKPRPSSMYDKKEPPSVQQPKKNLKVAFGHSAVSSDKKKVGAIAPSTAASNKSAGGGRSSLAAAGKNSMKMYSSPDLLKGKSSGGNGGGTNGGGLSGFAKLQLKAAKGPQIVTYEDEGPSAPRGGMGNRGRQNDNMDLELRGQSKYMPIRDDDESDFISHGGDQVDRLLNNARRGRFG